VANRISQPGQSQDRRPCDDG